MANKELNKLKILKNYSTLPKVKQTYAEKWLEELIFMDETLKNLQRDILEHGEVIEAVNGNGFTTRSENPAVKSYNVTIRNYNATLAHLIDMLPEDAEKDKLSEFLKNHKDDE